MPTSDTPADAVPPLLQAIDRLIASGDLHAAAARLDEAAQSTPGDPRIYLMAARMATAAHRHGPALDYVRHAAALSPYWEVPQVELALLLVAQNQPAAAQDAARRAVALAPNSLEVLVRVIDVAHRTLNPQLALEWLARADRLDPGNRSLQTLMAQDLMQLGACDRAVDIYTRLLETDATDTTARLGRAKAALAMDDRALARQDCAHLTAHDPANETYRFWHQVASGVTPATQPAAMMQTVFDSYAAVFDMHLEQGLQYRVPVRVAELVAERYPEPSFDLLDLGCGTGLLGKYLRPVQGRLVGVDLSTRMLEQAARLQRYHELHAANLLDVLALTPGAQYDVVAACDVFIYAGDLTDIVPLVWRVLRPGGFFMFSCETAQETEADLVLRPDTRYAHKRSQVQAQCAAAGFADITSESVAIRVEGGQPVDGYIVVAQKAG